MRILIFISIAFVLLNVLVYLLPTDVQTSNAKYASEPEINSVDIRFLIEDAAAQESIDVASLPTFDSSGSPEPVAESQVDSNSSESSAGDKNETCYRIGPFLRESRVDAVGSQLKDLVIAFSLVERQPVNVLANRVYVGPFSDASQAVAARRQLSTDGINDHFHRKENDGSYIVSLGIYSKKDSAEQQQEQFRQQNIAALIREEETELPKNYWLELSKFTSTTKIESIAGISWGESSVSLGRHPCQHSRR